MENLVVAGVDGSPESRGAAQWALAEASARRWPILFVKVHPPLQVADPQVEVGYRHSARQAANALFEELKSAAKALGVTVHCKLLAGHPGDVLVELSAKAGLSVVGHRDRTGLPSRLGSVAAALAAHAHCPTAVIPAGLSPESDPTDERPDADTSRFAGNIVAAVDPGPAAAAVLSAAADMARRHHRSLHAVTVGPAADGQSEIPELLARLTATHEELRYSVHTLDGRPVHEIAQAARDSWLLVVGTRGIGGLSGLLRGSVSQALLQHVTSPVLVVPGIHPSEPE